MSTTDDRVINLDEDGLPNTLDPLFLSYFVRARCLAKERNSELIGCCDLFAAFREVGIQITVPEGSIGIHPKAYPWRD